MMLSVQPHTSATDRVVNMVGMPVHVSEYCSCLNTDLSADVVTLAFRWQCNTETVLDVFLWHSLVAGFVFFIPASHFGLLMAILWQIYLAWPVQPTTAPHSILAQWHGHTYIRAVGTINMNVMFLIQLAWDEPLFDVVRNVQWRIW